MKDDVKRCVEAMRICHSNKDCRDCKFVDSDQDEMSCVNVLFVNAADLIESLAAELEQVKQERDGLNILLAQAQSMLETRTRERDAAVKDVEELCKEHSCNTCHYCEHYDEEYVSNDCMDCIDDCNWLWRGVKENDQCNSKM